MGNYFFFGQEEYLIDEEINKFKEKYLDEVKKSSNRTFITGFYYGKPGPESQMYDGSEDYAEKTYLGTIHISDDGRPAFVQKNKFCVGDEIEVIRPGEEPITTTVRGLINEKGEAVDSAPHASETLYPDLGIKLNDFDMMRK